MANKSNIFMVSLALFTLLGAWLILVARELAQWYEIDLRVPGGKDDASIFEMLWRYQLQCWQFVSE